MPILPVSGSAGGGLSPTDVATLQHIRYDSDKDRLVASRAIEADLNSFYLGGQHKMSSGGENVFFSNLTLDTDYWPTWCGIKDQSIVANQDATGIIKPSVRIVSDNMVAVESNGVKGTGSMDCAYMYTPSGNSQHYSGTVQVTDAVTADEWIHFEVFAGTDDTGTLIYMQDYDGYSVVAGEELEVVFEHPLDVLDGQELYVAVYRRPSRDDLSNNYLSVLRGTTDTNLPWSRDNLRTFTDETVSHSASVASFDDVFGDETGLVLDVPFTEIGTDVTQYDRSPSAFALTNQGSPVVAATYGAYGSGAYFDSTCYISTAVLPQLDTWSVEMSARLDGTPATRTLISKDVTGFSNDLILQATSSLGLKLSLQEDGQYNYINGLDVLVEGEQFTVTITYDGTTMRLYKDGVELGTPIVKAGLFIASDSWNIAAAKFGATPFKGYVDYVKVYERALDPEEVVAHHMRHGGNSIVRSSDFKVIDLSNNLNLKVTAAGTETTLVSADGQKSLSFPDGSQIQLTDTATGGASGINITNIQDEGRCAINWTGKDHNGFLYHSNQNDCTYLYEYGDSLKLGGGPAGTDFLNFDFRGSNPNSVRIGRSGLFTHTVSTDNSVMHDGARNRLEVTPAKTELISEGGIKKLTLNDDNGLVTTGPVTSEDKFMYLGDANTDGSWRIKVNGTALEFDRRDSGTWNNITTMT